MRNLPKIVVLCVLLPAKLLSQTGSSCLEHVANVSVLDQNGIPLKDLHTRDFRASVRGKTVGVVSSEYTEHTANRIAVLLDASGSMRAKWDAARSAATEVVSSAPADAQVSLTVFAEKVEQQFDGAGARQPIKDWLSSGSARELKNVRGPTALYDTIVGAVKSLGPTRPGDAVYVITDGGGNDGRGTMALADRSLQSATVRLFVLLFDSAPRRTEEEERGTQEIAEMTVHTGGLLVSLEPYAKQPPRRHGGDDWWTRAIQSATNSILAGISGYYVMILSDSPAGGQNWQLKVVDENGRERKHLRVAYPRKLAGCTAQTAQN
jgi:hypothetical protein